MRPRGGARRPRPLCDFHPVRPISPLFRDQQSEGKGRQHAGRCHPQMPLVSHESIDRADQQIKQLVCEAEIELLDGVEIQPAPKRRDLGSDVPESCATRSRRRLRRTHSFSLHQSGEEAPRGSRGDSGCPRHSAVSGSTARHNREIPSPVAASLPSVPSICRRVLSTCA
jgi:hypothetical protein